jgi:hypothetical protein
MKRAGWIPVARVYISDLSFLALGYQKIQAA